MAKKPPTNEIITATDESAMMVWKCNYHLTWMEYINLREKANVEQIALGKPIIIIPHAVDVVKT